MLTDLTSSPWAARLIVNRVGPRLEAAGISRAVRSLVYAAVASPVGWQTFVDPNPKPRYVRHRERAILWDTPAEV